MKDDPCNKESSVVYYAVAQVIHKKLRILADLDSSPNAEKRMEDICQGLSTKGRKMMVVEIKIASAWEGDLRVDHEKDI